MKTLLDFEKREPNIRSNRSNFSPTCVNCVLDPNSEDASKYPCRYERKKLRPILEYVVGNMWRCPRCKEIHYSLDFHGKRKRRRKF